MNTNQERNASLPIKRDLTLVYAFSLIVAILMAAASITGILYRTVIYPTDELLRAFVPNDVVNLFVGLPILIVSMLLALARQADRVALLAGRALVCAV